VEKTGRNAEGKFDLLDDHLFDRVKIIELLLHPSCFSKVNQSICPSKAPNRPSLICVGEGQRKTNRVAHHKVLHSALLSNISWLKKLEIDERSSLTTRGSIDRAKSLITTRPDGRTPCLLKLFYLFVENANIGCLSDTAGLKFLFGKTHFDRLSSVYTADIAVHI